MDSHVDLINTYKEEYGDVRLKEILYYLNQCIIEGVSKSLWSEVKNDVKITIDGLFDGYVEPFTLAYIDSRQNIRSQYLKRYNYGEREE